MSEKLMKHYKSMQYDLGVLGIETTVGCGHSFGEFFVCTRHAKHEDKIVHIATGMDDIVLLAGYDIVEPRK